MLLEDSGKYNGYMFAGRPTIGWRLALVLVLTLAPLAWGREAQWVEVHSPHFSVVTDAGERRGREVAIRFEQMRAVFGALMTKAQVNLPVPLQIVAFRSTKEMRQFVPLWHGKPMQVSGLFARSDDRSFILLDLSVNNPWETVFHEYGHQLLESNTSSEVPAWFDEGFAEYFSTVQVSGKNAEVGLPVSADVGVLRGGSWLKMRDLLRVRTDSSIYNEANERRSVFYAESWLAVHFLFDKQWISKAAHYFDLVAQKDLPVEDAMQQSFGVTGQQWDISLRDYFLSGRVGYYNLRLPEGIETSGYTVAPISAPDAKAVLADMHAHSADYQGQAIAEFEEVLKQDPNNLIALRGLGYAYLRKQDYQRAGEYFEKAAEHDSKDPRVLYYSALLINRQRSVVLPQDRDKLQRMVHNLEASLALDPSFADTYNLLALGYTALNRNQDALKTMIRAAELDPRNENYRFNLAQMYAANGDFANGSALLERLKNSSNPKMAAAAGESLLRLEEYRLALQAKGAVADSTDGGKTVMVPIEMSPEREPSTSPASAQAGVMKGKELAPAKRMFAPYIDMNKARNNLPEIQSRSGIKYFTLAFIVSGGSCVPSWAGTVPLEKDMSFASYIRQVRQRSGDVIIAFGGYENQELGVVCPDVKSLQAAYQAVIAKYQVTMLDFDVEAAAIDHPASIDRRSQALRALADANPELQISFTLPVHVTGLPDNALAVLKSAMKYEVPISVVNLMTMDYTQPPSEGMGQAAIRATKNAIAQMDAIGLQAAVGISPMIGMNDAPGQTFTPADARLVLNYAKSNPRVARLAMWSVGRDNGSCSGKVSPECSGIAQPEWEFSRTFLQY